MPMLDLTPTQAKSIAEAEKELNQRSPVQMRRGKLIEKGASYALDARLPADSKRSAML